MANREHRIFFLIGMPKSGTTWVQLLLDAHPNLSCPPEVHFDHLRSRIDDALGTVNKDIKRLNRITGGRDEARLFADDDVDRVFRAALLALLERPFREPSTVASGLKDNSFVPYLFHLAGLFPGALYVIVVRDPRDVAVSAWHYNRRLDDGFAARAGAFRSWHGEVVRPWAKCTDIAGKFIDGNRQNCAVVRYEDLSAAPADTVADVYRHLGVETGTSILSSAVDRADFRELSGGRESGNEDPASFYRKGVAGDCRTYFDDDMLTTVDRIAGPVMARFQYTL